MKKFLIKRVETLKKNRKENSKRERSSSSSEDKSVQLINKKQKRKNEEYILLSDGESDESSDFNETNDLEVISTSKEIKFFKNITQDSYTYRLGNNTFSVFKSFNNNIIYLIYVNKNHSIISYNLMNQKKLNEIRNAHQRHITCINYYFDKIHLSDLIISISGHDNNVKIWNPYNWICLLNLKNINEYGDLYSSCMLYDKKSNQNYVLTSNCYGNSEPIKIYDMKGRKIKEMKSSKENIIFMDIYYERNKYKNYILTGNEGYVKSYDFNNNKVYNKYWDNDYRSHYNIIINDYKSVVKLIESSEDGNIRIWNFHSRELLKKINASDRGVYGICLWDPENLFVGCEDKNIKLINLKNGKIIKILNGHKNRVINIKKIIMPKYGECLMSQGDFEEKIKLWINKKSLKNNF